MSGYNHITLVGNLANDPETRMAGDIPISVFRLAVNGRKKEDGTSPVDFINIVAWRKLGDLCTEYLEKGRRILVDGKLHINEYEKDKKKNWIAEVHADNVTFLDFPQNGSTKEAKSSK